jgi:hypothetical protein
MDRSPRSAISGADEMDAAVVIDHGIVVLGHATLPGPLTRELKNLTAKKPLHLRARLSDDLPQCQRRRYKFFSIRECAIAPVNDVNL